jgi:hypothetical protein
MIPQRTRSYPRERLFQIALEHTPQNIRYVKVLHQLRGTRTRIHDGWIAAQVPSTPVRLWYYLHECKHMELHDSLDLSYWDQLP